MWGTRYPTPSCKKNSPEPTCSKSSMIELFFCQARRRKRSIVGLCEHFDYRRLVKKEPIRTIFHKNIKERTCTPLYLIVSNYWLIVLESCLVRNSQLLAALCSTSSQHLAAIRSSHTSAETVLVDALAARWLVSSFHCHNCIVFIVLVSCLSA